MPHRNRIVPNQGVLIFSRRVLCSAHKWKQVPNLLIKEQAFHFAQSVNRKSGVSVKPGTLPEHRGTPRKTLEHPQNSPEQPGTTPEHPWNIPLYPGTPSKQTGIPPEHQNSGQRSDAHELTKPKTFEDSQFFRRLWRITLRFPSISRISMREESVKSMRERSDS